MSLSSDASPETAKIGGRGKVLKFPGAPATARRSWPGAREYGLATATVAIVVGGSLAVALWSLSGKPAIQYTTAPVGRGDVTKTIATTGTLNPVLTAAASASVPGVIQNVFCDYNTPVKAGQVCAKIDPRPYQATLDQYSAQLLRDQAILDKDRADFTRYQKLTARSSIARQQTESQTYLVNQDAATVKLDQALVDSARLNLGYTDIVSPVDGTVVSLNATVGQTVAAGLQAPALFLIAADLRQMQVETDTRQGDIGTVKVGDSATVTVDAFPQRLFQGAVTQVRQAPKTVQNIVTYEVIVGVQNEDLALVPGMTASTQIVVDRHGNVTRVPDQALHYTPAGLSEVAAPAAHHGRVWVLRDGKPAAVQVVLGLDDGNYAEIVEGDFRPGDRVITAESNGQANGQSDLPAPRL
jgi:HlyD family secretion protein